MTVALFKAKLCLEQPASNLPPSAGSTRSRTKNQDAFGPKELGPFDEHKAIPIFMSDDLSDRHYNGFSNSILWPLFHYHPGEITFDESAWDGYTEANRLFATTIAADLKDNDLVWVQDYHMMLLPKMLREEIENQEIKPKNVKISF